MLFFYLTYSFFINYKFHFFVKQRKILQKSMEEKFSDLKSKLRNHNGLSKEHRIVFIVGIFANENLKPIRTLKHKRRAINKSHFIQKKEAVVHSLL